MVIGLAVGCGFSGAGTRDSDVLVPPADAGAEGAVLPDLDATSAAGDGPAPTDAEADRPDAGTVFVPSHIQPVYSLAASDVTIAIDTEVDTTARTIKPAGGAATVSADLTLSPEGATVWSVGALTIDASMKLIVRGSRPLVIVATRAVTLNGAIDGAAGAVAGPGGASPAMGAGKGADGMKNNNDAAGGGGAGYASIGATGGLKNAALGGLGGAVTNASSTVLAGGSGGGHGGGFANNACNDATRGRGGPGGGAIQISALGKISVSSTGGIYVGGGGGSGGCKDSGGNDAYTGGGGGGAGGTVVLESVAGVELAALSLIAAGGGGGGEGGEGGKNGTDGQPGPYGIIAATGGNGGNGGDGGAGGIGGGAFVTLPFPGFLGDSGGGGGGAAGRLLIGTRGVAPVVGGAINALRTDYAF